MSHSTAERIGRLGVFPIVVLRRISDVQPLGEALNRAGLSCVEVTFRTDIAAEAISLFSKQFPELLLGAGTVLTIDQARQAFDSGAEFVLTPGFNPRVVDFCLEQGKTIFPGVCTPTEMEAALGKGLTTLKFFPAGAMGGVSYLKAVAGPLPMLRFLPTGGVNLQNLREYLAFDKVAACAGSWIVREEWLVGKRFDLIEETAAASLRVVAEVRGGE